MKFTENDIKSMIDELTKKGCFVEAAPVFCEQVEDRYNWPIDKRMEVAYFDVYVVCVVLRDLINNFSNRKEFLNSTTLNIHNRIKDVYGEVGLEFLRKNLKARMKFYDNARVGSDPDLNWVEVVKKFVNKLYFNDSELLNNSKIVKITLQLFGLDIIKVFEKTKSVLLAIEKDKNSELVDNLEEVILLDEILGQISK